MHKKHSNLHKIADAQGYAKRMQTVIPNTTFLSPGRKVEAVGLVESILRLSSNDSGSIGFAVSLKNKLSIIENEMIANRNAGKVQDEEVQGKRTSGALSGQAKHFMPMKETVRIVTFAGEAEISAARKAAQGLKAKVKSGECSGFGYEINDVLDSLRLGKQVTVEALRAINGKIATISVAFAKQNSEISKYRESIAALAEKSMYLTKDEKQELGAYSRALGRGDSLGDIAGGINGIEAEARKRERNYARLTELGKKPLRADDRDMLDEFKHRVTHATAQDAFRMKKLDWARLEATLDRLGKGWEAPSVDIDAAIREMLDPKNSECLPEGVLSSLRLVRDRKETFAEDWVEYIVKLRYMEMNESKKQSLLARIGFIIACGLADDRPASQEMEILKSATDAIAKGALPQGEQMALLAKTLEKCESRTEERGQRNFENMMDSGYY